MKTVYKSGTMDVLLRTGPRKEWITEAYAFRRLKGTYKISEVERCGLQDEVLLTSMTLNTIKWLI